MVINENFFEEIEDEEIDSYASEENNESDDSFYQRMKADYNKYDYAITIDMQYDENIAPIEVLDMNHPKCKLVRSTVNKLIHILESYGIEHSDVYLINTDTVSRSITTEVFGYECAIAETETIGDDSLIFVIYIKKPEMKFYSEYMRFRDSLDFIFKPFPSVYDIREDQVVL